MIAAIDPGLNEAGWCLLGLRRRRSNNKAVPIIIAAGVTKDKSVERADRALRIASKTASAINQSYKLLQKPNEKITRVVVEWPQLRSDAISQAAAVKGDLQMLTMMAGACIAYLSLFVPYTFSRNLITPSEWKGQLSKSTTRKRLERFFGSPLSTQHGDKIITHAIDAVGIGLHAMGFPMNCGLWKAR